MKEEISQQNSHTNCYANSHSSQWTAVRWLAHIPAAPLGHPRRLAYQDTTETLEIRGTEILKKIFTKRNMNWGFCLFNKSLQGTCFNWIATSTAKQIKICKTFPQPFQGVKPVIWLKSKPGLSAQVWCNYAPSLPHWGISLELIIFHRSWKLDHIFASP